MYSAQALDPCPKKKNVYERRSCPGCHTAGTLCCAGAVSEYFQSSEFENIFSKRNSLEAHAIGFWEYDSLMIHSAYDQPYGLGSTCDNDTYFGTKEVAAFLAHVGTKTSCQYFTLYILTKKLTII